MTDLIERVGRLVGPINMGWQHVFFANWPVDAEVVEPHVPDAMTLDTFDGRAWLSVVAFMADDVRPTWLPAGWGVRLPGLNLRTYVTVDGEPGVYFFNLDAHGLLGVVGGRLFHHLPYYYAKMRLDVRDDEVVFSSRRRHPGARPVRFQARYGPAGAASRPAPGSLEAFVAKRYRYYTESPDGALRYAVVRHERWPLHRARASIAENWLFAANGFPDPDTEPVYYYSPGVDPVATESRRV